MEAANQMAAPAPGPLDLLVRQQQQEQDGLVVFEHGGERFSFDLRTVAAALYRVNEVAHANRNTAQVLADAYADSQAELAKIITRAASALAAAKHETKRVYGQLLLEYVPDELKKRDLKDAVDRRDALILQHSDYKDALDKERHLEWVAGDLRNKKERIYHAFTIARAIMGERFERHHGSSSHGAPPSSQHAGQYGQARY